MLDCLKKALNHLNFKCERLRENNVNHSLISGFSSIDNPNLSRYFKTYGWMQDTDGQRAYYLVKDGDKIVLYFSLQCGTLVKCHQKILSGIAHRINDEKDEYFIDKDVIDVSSTVPAIEISHFCVNETYRKKKKTWQISNLVQTYSVGEYCFYKFVVPKILEIATLVGIRQVYLFCADDGSDKLIKYYENIHFRIMDDMACIRSEYDQRLRCMTQKINDLSKHYDSFLDDENAHLVLNYLKTHEYIKCKENLIPEIHDLFHLLERMKEKGLIRIHPSKDGAYLLPI